jgi:DNA mismatch endonuclease (patch repair protein)
MSAVRSRGNQSTEGRFRALLRLSDITGWRRKTTVYGKPDFVFWSHRVAVFLDGCFWHGCPRGCRNIPATNREFWEEKIESNRRRDKDVNRVLKAAGWSVIRVWEHALRTDPNGVIRRLRAALQQPSCE